MKIEDLKEVKDPYQRAQAACDAIERAHAFIEEAIDVRNFALTELYYHHGETLRTLATRYKISKSLVAGVVK
jgi:hypothetical protein